MAPIKIILFCGSRLALPTLKELAFNQLLAAVVIPSHCDEMLEEVKAGLTGSGIAIIEVTKQSFVAETIKAIGLHQANMGLMITFSYKIPASVYLLPAHGFYNVHPAPLPAYRGPDPIFRQIKNREKYAGATVHLLDDNFDTGPIFIKESIKLEITDTYGILTTKLADLSARLVMVLIKLISFETKIPFKKQDGINARYYKKQTAKDVTINWGSMDSDDIVALINACNPWNKGAVSKINNKIIRLLGATRMANNPVPGILPGTIVSTGEGGITVATINNGLLKITLVSADEGFLQADRFSALGIFPGQCFEHPG